jgi:hypothetical protein
MEQLIEKIKIKMEPHFVDVFRLLLIHAVRSNGGHTVEKLVVNEFCVKNAAKFVIVQNSRKKHITFTLYPSAAVAIYVLFLLSNFEHISLGNTVANDVIETIDKTLRI